MPEWLDALRQGLVIPAHPLALTAERRLDEEAQRGLTRYYIRSGAGGVAVGVHTTQFAIRDPRHNLLETVLRMAAEELASTPMVRIAGVCGPTAQALKEAELARSLGYHAGLVSLAALASEPIPSLVEHIREVSKTIPVIGFYLQPAVGGRLLPYEFWRAAAEIEGLVAIKIAPFNRYQTLDVIRAVADSGRADSIALYTGNDDNIVADLLTPFTFNNITLRICGGLLGQWAVGTAAAVKLLNRIHAGGAPVPLLLALGAQITDLNAALFDAANSFHGCIAGIHEVLRRQGLMRGIWCLDPAESLSPGQLEEIDRVAAAYPHLLE